MNKNDQAVLNYLLSFIKGLEQEQKEDPKKDWSKEIDIIRKEHERLTELYSRTY